MKEVWKLITILVVGSLFVWVTYNVTNSVFNHNKQILANEPKIYYLEVREYCFYEKYSSNKETNDELVNKNVVKKWYGEEDIFIYRKKKCEPLYITKQPHKERALNRIAILENIDLETNKIKSYVIENINEELEKNPDKITQIFLTGEQSLYPHVEIK